MLNEQHGGLNAHELLGPFTEPTDARLAVDDAVWKELAERIESARQASVSGPLMQAIENLDNNYVVRKDGQSLRPMLQPAVCARRDTVETSVGSGPESWGGDESEGEEHEQQSRRSQCWRSCRRSRRSNYGRSRPGHRSSSVGPLGKT